MLVDGPHFQATDDGELVFLLSDGDNSRRPTEHETLELEEESGTVRENYYLRVPLDHPDSHRWRAEIAKYLAPLVLGSTYNSLTTTRRTYAPSPSLPSDPHSWLIFGHHLTPNLRFTTAYLTFHLPGDLNAPRLHHIHR